MHDYSFRLTSREPSRSLLRRLLSKSHFFYPDTAALTLLSRRNREISVIRLYPSFASQRRRKRKDVEHAIPHRIDVRRQRARLLDISVPYVSRACPYRYRRYSRSERTRVATRRGSIARARAVIVIRYHRALSSEVRAWCWGGDADDVAFPPPGN